MKSKVIRKVLREKLHDWVSSIDNESLRGLVRQETIITGGAIASMLLNENVNDFDVYFRTREAAVRVGQYYLDKFGNEHMKLDVTEDRVRVVTSSGHRGATAGDPIVDSGDIEDTYSETEKASLENEDPGYRPVFVSTNAITLSGKIQIVLRFFGEPDTIHENYDFVHCTNYWTSWDDDLVLKPAALEALLSRELKYVGSKYPVCSVVRIRKFVKRGWTINAGQILKMVMQISDLDLKDPKVLEEQLTGVDSAYFVQLIQKLTDKDPDKVNTAYLVEIVDRMF